MKWTKLTEYSYPGPIFYQIDWHVIEQKEFYYRVLGKATVETRVNGKGTCFARVEIIMFGQCGKWITQLYRHFEDKRAPSQKAKKWCELLLLNPPRIDHKVESNTEILNGQCRKQMELARINSMDTTDIN